jgi:hypothetical protein
MLCVEDYLFALNWAESLGGLAGLMARAQANAEAVWDFCDTRDWIDNLAVDPATRSVTSVCLKFTDPRIQDPAGFAKAVAKRLEARVLPSTLAPIATRQQACVCGAVPRLKPQTSWRCCPGWNGLTAASLTHNNFELGPGAPLSSLLK